MVMEKPGRTAPVEATAKTTASKAAATMNDDSFIFLATQA
jgi:hypothetical protein